MATNRFSIGDYIVDTEADARNPAVVVNKPPQRANEWVAFRNTTVAEDNPDYDPESIVVIVAFVNEILENDAEEYLDPSEPVPISDLHDHDIKDYAFPDGRMAFFAGEIPGVGRIDPPEDAEEDEIVGDSVLDSESESSSESPSEDESVGEHTEDEKVEDESQPIPEPLRPVATHLDENDVEYDVTDEGLRIEKLNQVYEVDTERTVTGEGLHYDQIAELVEAAPDEESEAIDE